MGALRVGRLQGRTTSIGVRTRADATCMAPDCTWQRLGTWGEPGGASLVGVTVAAREHAIETGHETMVDTIARRSYIRRLRGSR